MEGRDRLMNLALLVATVAAWVAVGFVLTTRDPIAEPVTGFVGAALIGAAAGLTCIPLFWLAVYARHRRIAYRGDWLRAVRRGAWIGLVVGLLVAFRVQGVLSLPVALFVGAIVVFAEVTLTVER